MVKLGIIEIEVIEMEGIISFSVDDINDIVAARSITRDVNRVLEGDHFDHAREVSGGILIETVTLDFEEIPWLSSVGLNELIAINRHARVRGIRLVLSNVRPSVREVFQLTRLERMFNFAESESQVA